MKLLSEMKANHSSNSWLKTNEAKRLLRIKDPNVKCPLPSHDHRLQNLKAIHGNRELGKRNLKKMQKIVMDIYIQTMKDIPETNSTLLQSPPAKIVPPSIKSVKSTKNVKPNDAPITHK